LSTFKVLFVVTVKDSGADDSAAEEETRGEEVTETRDKEEEEEAEEEEEEEEDAEEEEEDLGRGEVTGAEEKAEACVLAVGRVNERGSKKHTYGIVLLADSKTKVDLLSALAWPQVSQQLNQLSSQVLSLTGVSLVGEPEKDANSLAALRAKFKAWSEKREAAVIEERPPRAPRKPKAQKQEENVDGEESEKKTRKDRAKAKDKRKRESSEEEEEEEEIEKPTKRRRRAQESKKEKDSAMAIAALVNSQLTPQLCSLRSELSSLKQKVSQIEQPSQAGE